MNTKGKVFNESSLPPGADSALFLRSLIFLRIFFLSVFLCCLSISHVRAAGDETPPNSDRSAGASNESFQTNLFSGTFSQSIPIVVPPGTKLQPSLALTYNSGAVSAQTILGAGWSLSGLGSIERSTKKGVPKYDDTPPSGTDTYILNLGSTNDLVYVSNDTNSPYHTKSETFLRIKPTAFNYPYPDTSKGVFSSVYWVVTDKNGTQFRFGFNADSNAVALNSDGTSKTAHNTDGTSRIATRAWYLDKVTDTHGNYIVISYIQDTINGGVYPSKITYTKNDTIPLNFYRTIDFSYESRPDIITDYSSGSLVRINQRLKTIDIRVNGTLAREYQLAYNLSPVSGKSLFQSIQEIGADAASGTPTKLPPTIFSYQANAAGWTKDGSVPICVEIGLSRYPIG